MAQVEAARLKGLLEGQNQVKVADAEPATE
jgi:hypothetical protein